MKSAARDVRWLAAMRLLVVSAVALAAACGPGPDPGSGTDAEGGGAVEGERVELATPEEGALAPMRDGSELALVFGPQGGYHVDVGVRMFGFDPDGARLRYEVWDPETARALHFDAVYALHTGRLRRVGDHWERTGDRAILDIADPGEVAGRTVDVTAVISLEDGRELADVRTVAVGY